MFYRIYNISAMKMHQMTSHWRQRLEELLVGFSLDIIFGGDMNKPTCNKNIIGGIRKTSIKDFKKLFYYL